MRRYNLEIVSVVVTGRVKRDSIQEIEQDVTADQICKALLASKHRIDLKPKDVLLDTRINQLGVRRVKVNHNCQSISVWVVKE